MLLSTLTLHGDVEAPLRHDYAAMTGCRHAIIFRHLRRRIPTTRRFSPCRVIFVAVLRLMIDAMLP